jgi:glutamate carboxypeptidase
MAHLICALEDLNDPENLISVNVGLATAGTAVNTVPGQAQIQVDFRFPTSEAGENLERAVTEILAAPTLAGARIEATEGITHMPLARTDAVARMAGRIISWGDDLGLSIVEERRGGCSDGNVAASVGCPVVDGLGVVGGNMHSPEEWMESQSLSERTALLALTAQRFYEL